MLGRCWKGFVMGILLGMAIPKAYAGYDYQFEHRMVQHGQYESEVGGKLTRGVNNILYSWTELVKTPVEMGRGPRTGFLKSVVFGVPYGVARFISRGVVGVYEIATCPAPQGPIMSEVEGDVV